MKDIARKIDTEEYILSVFSPEDKLDAAFQFAREAFKKTSLTMQCGKISKEKGIR